MASVPRPLIALLLGTVVFFALWMTALKPSGSGKDQGALGAYQPAINKACNLPGVGHPAGCPKTGSPSTLTTKSPAAQTPSSGSTGAAAAGATAGSSAASGSSASQAHSHSANSAKPSTHSTPAAAQTGFAAVEAGLREHKVLALLFYNPAAADDRAVHQELASVPTHRGAVVKVAVPLRDLSRYSTLLNEVPVNFSPTLVLINRARQADEIAGFADTFEIDQGVAAALSSHG